MSSMNPKIVNWHGKRVWLVGASSGIGAALARELAARGARLALSARNAEKLAALSISHALIVPCDATDTAALKSAYGTVRENFSHIDLIIYLAGDYEPMQADNFDLHTAEKILGVNFIGAARLSSLALPHLCANDGIAFVASVAGYCGLPKALAYGPGKAALIHFAECLYFDLSVKKIGVWLINPGFVATQLTAKNDFSMPAMISPETAANEIIKGFASGVFEIHFPRLFTRTMKSLALLPYGLFFRVVRYIIKR